MNKFMKGTVAVAVTAGLFGTAQAQTYDCESASRVLATATQDLSKAVQKYGTCVGSSGGKIDCSADFGRVRDAQNDFERAVLANRRYCVQG